MGCVSSVSLSLSLSSVSFNKSLDYATSLSRARSCHYSLKRRNLSLAAVGRGGAEEMSLDLAPQPTVERRTLSLGRVCDEFIFFFPGFEKKT